MNFIVCISSSSSSWACRPRPCCCHRLFACRQGSRTPTRCNRQPPYPLPQSLHPQPSPPTPVPAIQLLHLLTRMFSIYTNVHFLYGYTGTKAKQPWCISVCEDEYNHTTFWCYLRDVKCVRRLSHSPLFSLNKILILLHYNSTRNSYNIWGSQLNTYVCVYKRILYIHVFVGACVYSFFFILHCVFYC